jgi:hypothetical protein
VRKSSQVILSASRNIVELPFDQAPQGLKDAVAKSGFPFAILLDILFRYSGSKGKVIYGIVEKDFWLSTLKNFSGNLSFDSSEYLNLDKTGIHRLVLELKKGNRLQGCHKVSGNWGKLDNRKRVLKAGSSGRNRSEIKRKNGSSSSQYVGVTWNKENENWAAHISFKYLNVNLGSFTSELDAKAAYDSVREKSEEVEEMLVGISDKNEMRRIIKSYL